MARWATALLNNWILLACAVFVLFATLFPTLSEAVNGERITVVSGARRAARSGAPEMSCRPAAGQISAAG